MTAQPALVVETEHGDGDDGPPPMDPDAIFAMFQRVLWLVGERGPIFQAAIDRAFEQVLVERETEETEK